MKIFEHAMIIRLANFDYLKKFLFENYCKKNLILIIGESNTKIDNELIELISKYPRCAFAIAPLECELHFIDLAKKIKIDKELLEMIQFKSKLSNYFFEAIQANEVI